MKTRRVSRLTSGSGGSSFRRFSTGCVLLVLAGLAAPVRGGAQAGSPATSSGDRARIPLGPVILQLHGKGDQVYRCQSTAGVAAWALDRPDALLLDAAGANVGSHGAGPAWHYRDGSSVGGTVLEKMPAQAPDSVPWLLLRASSHEGSGALTAVETVERTETNGGVAPRDGCDAAHLGAVTRVPYSATYTFRGKP